jgi:hypothetical protein
VSYPLLTDFLRPPGPLSNLRFLHMFRVSTPTQVPWKCDHCGAKYMVTLSGFLETGADSPPPCIKCKQKMNWSAMRPAAEFEPMFDTSEGTDVK